jgi:ArsR family transcriptional regulator, arsenate/arsenite/antimonite-responsive transcriptional repressor
MVQHLYAREEERSVAKLAGILDAMGTESRLRIVRLLLSAHPGGMVVGEIQHELGISPSTLSHHLDKLKNEQVVTVERQGTFLRCRANAPVLCELLAFFYSECCTRNAVIDARELVSQSR